MDANNTTPILPTEGLDGTASASVAAAASAYAQFALQAAALVPGQDGQLVLPAGVSLDNIRVVGRDLVIRMPDGSEVVVPDGAVFVPQFVIDGVAVPPVNLAALLIGQEPQPAAGPPQSSGGNFSQTPGDIGDPFGLGDLLPPTELAFPEPEQRELVPGLIDRDPDVNIQDGGPAGKDVTDNVSEGGLPGTRVNGNVETPGSSIGNGSDSTTGFIIVNSPDGIASITINGTTYTGVAGQQITTARGVLTLGALSGDQIPYTYRLTDNTSGDNTTDVFTVVLTDPDGDSSTARLTIVIADDVPTARNDTDSVAGGTYGPESGNVLSGSGTTSGAAGADTLGADGAAVTGFRAGSSGSFAAVGSTIAGQYGTLTIGANGSYTYVRNTNTPGGVSDVFTYQITDGDGDASTATLTINIGDAPNRITFIPVIGEGTEVREPHLPARDGEPSGSQFDGNSETTTGTITFTSPDGVGSVTVSGVTLTPGSLPQTIVSNATGTLVVTGYSYNPTTGVGSITYTYTLNDNTLNTSGSTVSFPVVVTDLDGDAASDQLNIRIIDDAPLANNDSGTQASENASVTVNVLTNDTPGADGVNPATGVALVAGSLTGAGSLTYAGNGNFTYTPAPGEEGIVTFKYTITDGDGDPSTATVTITLLKDSEPQVDVSGENFVDEAGLPARGSEPAGSNAAADSETTSGTIAVSTGGDTLQSLVINGVNVTAGGTVTGAHGTLTVTVSAGAYSYSYTLTDNTAGEGTTDSFNVVVTDSDGDSANDNLVIGIHDDVPTAIKDADSIAAGEYGPATGNVITDAEGDGGADTQGADGAAVTAVSGTAAGTVGGTTAGQYGVLTLNADGSYSYTRNPGTPGGVTDVFSYTITDGDGDPSTATLTINIDDSLTTLDLPTKGEAGTLVDEAGLPTGSNAASNSETTSGTIAYTAPDGPATVTIDGVAVTAVGQTFVGSFGTLTVTSIASGAIGYSYTLTTNTSGDATFDDFAVVVTDQDGDNTPGTLVIDIVDDVPTARADVDSVTEDGPIIADGNVITGANVADANATDGVADTKGADGASVTAVSFGATNGTVGSALAGTYGSLTLNADGSYSYKLNNEDPRIQGLDSDDTLTEVFTYTITDGDGDPSTTTLTITINGADDRITINGLNAQGPDLIVDEDDLSDGSSPNAPALTQTGSFTVNGLDGIASIRIEGTEAFVGQSFSTAYGTFTITSISAPANGTATSIVVGYSYVLTDNTAHANAGGENFITELFDVDVTDTDGSTDSNQVEVRIIDDVSTASPDTDIIAGGSNAPATGNVITDAAPGDLGDSDAGADVAGADGVTVTAVSGVAAGTVGGATNGQYGVLTLNADGSYSYVRNDGTPGNVIDTFTYTITDADGDSSTTTLTITIEDDRPVVRPNPTVVVDDDSLLGGNPASTSGDDVDPQNEAGFLSGSGGDGALTWAFNTSSAPAGFQYVASGSNILVQQDQGGSWVTVATVTLVPSTGAYTVTLNDNVIHPDGNNENNLSVTLNYTVSDVDLDATPGTLTINFDDDAPTATNESAQSIGEGGTINGTVDFVAGADGAGVTHVNGTALVFGVDGFSQSVDIGDGSIKVKADGTYVFTADNPVIGTGSANATFTITDGDKDTVTATAAFTITDVNKPTGGNIIATLDDDGLTGGNAGGTLDDDANATESPVTASEAVFSGILPLNFGLDGAGKVTFANLDGLFGLAGSEGVGYSWNEATSTLTASNGRGAIFTVQVNQTTGAFTVTLLQNIIHNGAGDENNSTNTILTYVVSDADNSSTTGTLRLNFDDDTPTMQVDGPITVVEGATANGTWTQSIGADLAGAVTKVIVGGTEYDIGTAINTGNGTLTVLANGTWSFVANNNLDNDLNPSVSFTVRVTDGDLDVAQDTQTVAITDGASPQAGGPLNLALDDQNLADGSTPLNPDFDSGTVSFTAGSDALTTFAFATNLGSLGGGLTWNRVSDTLIEGWDGPVGTGTKIVAIALTAPASIAANTSGTATVTATLLNNYDSHPTFTLDDLVALGSIGVVASDHDGDSATATVNVSVSDDVPTLAVSGPTTVVEGASVNGTWSQTIGADQPGATTVVVFGGNTYALGTPINTSNGTLTVLANGTWSFVANNNLDNDLNPSVTFTVRVTDADNDVAEDTQTVAITDGPPAQDATPITLDLNEAALATAGATGSNPSLTTETDSTPSLSFTAGSDALTSFQFSTNLSSLVSNLDGAGTDIVWVRAADGQSVTGYLGSAAGPIAVTLTLSAPASIAAGATGNVTVTATLSDNLPHANALLNQIQSLGSILVEARDHDGDVATGQVTVNVQDDVPTANADTNSGVEGAIIGGNVLPNDTFGADGPTSTTPTGGVVGVRAAGLDTTTPVTTGTGTQITGLYGKLTLNADGSYSYDGDPNVISSAQSDVFVYTIRDADGDLSTTTLTINLTPVTLVADNETATVNEAGLDLVNDAGPDTVPGTVNGSNPTSNSDVATGALAVAGATNYVLTGSGSGSYGTLVLNSNGTYSYTLTKPFDTTPDSNNGTNTETGKDVFTYTATDANGNSVTGTITIDIIDDVPAIDIAASGTTLIVDESLGTNGSVQNEGGRVNNDETLAGAAVGAIGYATGSIVSLATANAGADGEASRVYSLTVNNATSGLVDAVTNSNIVLVSVNATTVEGRVGSSGGAVSFRITVDPANGTATINQFRAVEHNDSTNHDENGGSEALMNSGVLSLGVTLTDGDGDRATDTVDVSQLFKFEDDGPAAIGESGTTNEILVDFNTAFVIDFSGSIDNTELNTQLVAVKAAINALFNSTGGNVSVKFVLFASSAIASSTFTTAAAANAYLDSVNPATGGTRPAAIGTSTDFSDAITTLLANYAADETANNQVFFLSDGNPNQNLGGSGQALNDTIRPLWNSFVNNNDINVTAIGVGGGIDNSNLQQIDVDGSGAPILVADFDDLIDTLTALFAPTPITGDLDINDDFGTDGGRILSIAIPAAGTDPVYTWNGLTGGASQITVSGGGATINGTTSFTATTEAGGKFTFDFATGQWSYTPPKTVPADTTELFNYTIVDGDGDTASATLSVLVENNDLPTTAPVTATVDDDGLTGGNAGGTGDLDANLGEVPASASEAVYNGTLNITATDNPIAAISFAQLQGTTSTIGQETVSYSWNAVTNLLTATITVSPDASRVGDTLFTVQLNNPSNGSYTVTLVDNVLHSNVAGENDASVALTYRVADTDGSTNTGVLNITFDDDTPAAYSTAPGTATGPNVGGTTDTEALNLPAIGADSPGTLAFTVTGGQQVLATNGSALTYNGQNLYYNLKTTDSSILEARTSATAGAGTLVFSIDLNPASGPTGQYVYTQAQQLSTAVLVPVTNLSSVGGGNVPAKAIDVPSSPYDIVLTTKTGATVNTNSSEIGVGSGQSLDDGDVIRIDFVNVTVTGSGGSAVATFNEYYSANAFRQDVSGLSGPQRADFTVKAISIVNNANGQALPADGDTVFYGDTNDTTVTGTTLNIYNAAGVLQTTAQLTAAGVTVTNLGSGVWRVLNLPNNYDYEIVSATTPFQAVQVDALTGTDTFKLGILSTSVLQVQGATFSVPIQYTDADGDFVSSTITINLSAPASPVVLDMDGDGAEFLSATAGVTFDYLGDGNNEATAWVSSDDGILAFDRNSDGIVNNGSEIVFGGNGLTDLEGLAANYDSNKDGVLDAADADFAKFGVWQDANSNGVTDAGEFQSLSDAGITSINLVSDGVEYAAADGDVTVHGTSSYTKADGTTGDVADASFATSGGSKTAANENDLRVLASANSGMASSMVAAGLVAAVAAAPEIESELLGKLGGGDFAVREIAENAVTDMRFEARDNAAQFDRFAGSESFDRGDAMQAAKFNSYEQIEDHGFGDFNGFGGQDSGSLISELLGQTEIEHAAYAQPDFVIGAHVDTASEALIAIQQADVFAKAAIEDVVADALAGGTSEGPNVDALLNALAGPANDQQLLGDNLAQTFGDNPVFEALSFNNTHDIFDQITTTQMELSAATGHHG